MWHLLLTMCSNSQHDLHCKVLYKRITSTSKYYLLQCYVSYVILFNTSKVHQRCTLWTVHEHIQMQKAYPPSRQFTSIVRGPVTSMDSNSCWESSGSNNSFTAATYLFTPVTTVVGSVNLHNRQWVGETQIKITGPMKELQWGDETPHTCNCHCKCWESNFLSHSIALLWCRSQW